MAEGYVFKISGDIAAYASELAKVPGVTDKAAAQAALKMGQQFAKMEADAAKSANLIVSATTSQLPLNLDVYVVYRITALAIGRRPGTTVVLQETYARQRMKD